MKEPITLGLNGNYYDLVLSDKIPFGFNDKLKAGNLVVNLDEKNFDAVCEVDSYNLILNTESNIDDYLKDKTFSYFNAKKAREITNNLILGINFVLYGVTLLLWMAFFVFGYKCFVFEYGLSSEVFFTFKEFRVYWLF